MKKVACAERLQSVEDAVYVLGGKWKLRIIIALVSGYNRFNEIQRVVSGISAKVLSTELKSLEINGLVERKVDSSLTPVLVTYCPTEYAETLKDLVTVLGNWGLNHKKRIVSDSV